MKAQTAIRTKHPTLLTQQLDALRVTDAVLAVHSRHPETGLTCHPFPTICTYQTQPHSRSINPRHGTSCQPHIAAVRQQPTTHTLQSTQPDRLRQEARSEQRAVHILGPQHKTHIDGPAYTGKARPDTTGKPKGAHTKQSEVQRDRHTQQPAVWAVSFIGPASHSDRHNRNLLTNHIKGVKNPAWGQREGVPAAKLALKPSIQQGGKVTRECKDCR